MSVLSKLAEAEIKVVEALNDAWAERSLVVEAGFDSVSEIVTAYKALQRKLEEIKQIEEASNRLRRMHEPSLGRMSRELGMPMKEICKMLVKGGFDVSAYNGYVLRPEHLAHLVRISSHKS